MSEYIVLYFVNNSINFNGSERLRNYYLHSYKCIKKY